MQGVKNVITKCHKLNIKQTKSTPLPLKKQNNTNLFIIFKKHLKHISMAYKVTANQNISLFLCRLKNKNFFLHISLREFNYPSTKY